MRPMKAPGEDQPSPGAFMGRIGYAFNENFAVEAELGFGGARRGAPP